MKRCLFLAVVIAALTTAVGASAQIVPPPPSWSLQQNDPDPFCGATAIRFGVAQPAQVQLAVWNAEMTQILRSLVNGELVAGLFTVTWDGRDDQNVVLPDGQYPYRINAQMGGTSVFEDTLVARIQCEVPVQPQTWGAVKGIYGR